MTAAGTAGEAAGGVLGGAIGGAIGAPILPPLGGLIGRWLGSRVGRAAGRAAAEVLANQMDDANDAAEEESTEDATETCAECGEIDCFNPPDGVDPEEFKRQLKEQQDALREMRPEEILDNMNNYRTQGRPSGDAAQRQRERDSYFSDHIESRKREVRTENPSLPEAEVEGMATDRLLNEMANLDATHIVDLVAGGGGAISGLGNRSVNRSIGSQWRHRGPNSQKTRAQQLQDYAEQAQREGADMSGLELEVCGDEGGAPDGNVSAPENATSPPSGDTGSGSVPMS
ncbi:polymorphic toxin type 15 domain-containing protein [Szabonella alba]|uniref:Novel toxin 15 domain-containing protein n=1 Tax=Szabonella alba TaxID=2804194 RepID=A0A8K0V6Y7_9RHOB|nr:polymorphic toxin type 15 domain-containing protein [Szabonella alba]MBL4916582.1 hypothetical protein [Szabonella alba]